MTARSLPCALCSACGAYSHDPEMIGKVCGAQLTADQNCEGCWQSRGRFTDWTSCENCRGTGYRLDRRCPYCKSSGWLPSR